MVYASLHDGADPRTGYPAVVASGPAERLRGGWPALAWAAAALALLVASYCGALLLGQDAIGVLCGASAVVPSLAFGLRVRRASALEATGAAASPFFFARRDLGWMLCIALLQMQACCAAWEAREYWLFLGRSARPLGLLGAALGGSVNVFQHLLAAKVLALVPLALWNLGWSGLVARTPLRAGNICGAAILGAGYLASGLVGASFLALVWFTVLWGGIFRFDELDVGRLADTRELTRAFHADAADLERLRAMLEADRRLGAIGDDRIGSWRRHPYGWADGPRRTEDLAAVLDDVGLTAERHREYVRLLGTVGAHDATSDGPDISLLLARQQLFLRACEQRLVWFADDVPPPDKRSTAESGTYRIHSRLGRGWFLRESYD